MQQGVSCTDDIGLGLGGCRRGGGSFGGRVGPGHPGRLILWGFGAVLTQGLLMLVFFKAPLDRFCGPYVNFIVPNII